MESIALGSPMRIVKMASRTLIITDVLQVDNGGDDGVLKLMVAADDTSGVPIILLLAVDEAKRLNMLEVDCVKSTAGMMDLMLCWYVLQGSMGEGIIGYAPKVY
jgi:hypothetical protein